MERNWWEYGEDWCHELYDRYMSHLHEQGDEFDWVDDSAVWVEVIEIEWYHIRNMQGCTDLRFDADPTDWMDVADYLNHWDVSDRPTLHKLADWMCNRYKKENSTMPKHMKELRTASPDDKYALTWRDLMVRIEELPEDELDMPAEVWVYGDTEFYDGGHPVYGLNPYDAGAPIGPCNHSSIDIG